MGGHKPLPPALFLMGPTASGKTDLAVELVQRLPLEIISVDSAQVYRGMDIGSAKPEPEILEKAPHRLIDIRDPEDAYSAAEFREDALEAMSGITTQGRIPLLTGGTMLYFRVLQQGLSQLPSADQELRARLEMQLRHEGLNNLHRRLQELDPDAAARIHPNDPQRTLRALEVIELTGRPMTEMQQNHPGETMPYRVLKLILAPQDRSVLHQRIEQRFNNMLLQGFEDEVRLLLREGNLTPNLPSMRSVGYRQMLGYLMGEFDWGEMVERGIIATRQLAKRQYTWLRSEQDAHWLDERGGDLPEQVCLLFDEWMSNLPDRR